MSGCRDLPGRRAARMNSRTHPEYETRFRLEDWLEYERSLVRRGAQLENSDLALEKALTLRHVFHLPLRRAEGALRSLIALMGVELDVPDRTTLPRCSRGLAALLHRGPAVCLAP